MPKWNRPCHVALYQSIDGVKIKTFNEGPYLVLGELLEGKTIEESISNVLDNESNCTRLLSRNR